MPIKTKTIRGIRDSIPGGYVIGRLPGTGKGPAGLIKFTANADGGVGGTGTGGSTSVLFGNIDGGHSDTVYTPGLDVDGGGA